MNSQPKKPSTPRFPTLTSEPQHTAGTRDAAPKRLAEGQELDAVG